MAKKPTNSAAASRNKAKAANKPAKVTPPTPTEAPTITPEAPPEPPAPVSPPTKPTQNAEATPAPLVELVRDGTTGKKYVAKTDPDSKYHLRDRSDIAKPVAVVHTLCAENPTLTRKEVIELCIARGVNKNTAMTQYSMWKKKQVAPGIPGMVAMDGEGNEVDFEG